VHAELARRFLFGGGAKAVEAFDDAQLLKTQLRQRGNEFCLRQSPGDSTGPEVNIAADVFAECGIDRDVGQLKTASGAKHAE